MCPFELGNWGKTKTSRAQFPIDLPDQTRERDRKREREKKKKKKKETKVTNKQNKVAGRERRGGDR
jgi:hypothetical protein